MILYKYPDAAFADSFGISMATAGAVKDRNTAWGIVKPGQSSAPHHHDEREGFVVISGTGQVGSAQGAITVGAGDIVRFAPFEPHVIANMGKDDLVFADVYWRDAAAATDEAIQPAQDVIKGRPVFVFSTPPTPNGDLHIGHLSGPYLGADVYTRFQRQNGATAYHLTGSDDFQSYVVGRAAAEGKQPQEVAAYYAAEIQDTLAMMDIHTDQFTVTQTAPDYAIGAEAFSARLMQSDLVSRRSLPALFDAQTGAYLYEVDVSGTCPTCRHGCGGNICEECGAPNICADLVEPASKLSNSAPCVGEVDRYAIDMQSAAQGIRAHQKNSMVPPRIQALTEQVLSSGPHHIPITHPSDWGIRPGGDASSDQVFWVWPEMAYGFLYGIAAIDSQDIAPRRHDAPSDDWKIVHFFGYDNSFYHAILYPALYAAAYPDWQPDIDYHVNEFYLLDGLKFSTSRRHAIWGKDILTPDTVDAVRLYLSLTRAETQRTNFSPVQFDSFLNTTLRGDWEGWLTDLGQIVAEDFNGTAPDAGDWSRDHIAFWGQLEFARRQIGQALGATAFSLNKSARGLLTLVEDCRDFAQRQSHLRTVPEAQDRWRTAVALQLAAARLLSQIAAPVIPRFSANLAQSLGHDGATEWPAHPTLVPAGTSISLACMTCFETPQLDMAAE